MPLNVIVMGVSGSGKSTLAQSLARELSAKFIEADDLHSDANLAQMTAGHPLTDDMRWPWLEACATEMNDHPRAVMACSALRRTYRDFLRRRIPDLRFVYPRLSKEQVRQRLEARRDHFMPATLLDSQFDTLEPPGLDEFPVLVPGTLSLIMATRLAAEILRGSDAS